jgi:excisionase family DNA binding protein
MSADKDKELLTTQEAAARLGLSRRTVQLMIKAGEIPAFRAGLRAWRIRAEDLEAYIKQHSNRSPPSSTPPE